MMLQVESLDAGYGAVQVLHGVDLAVGPGEVVALLGRNGAGKTTLLRTIMGLVRARRGVIRFQGEDLAKLPAHAVPQRGIGYVPQGRRLFAAMTVEENLRIGLLAREGGPDRLEHVLSLFPVLRERLHQRAGTLSGGEQQMAATARALCLGPRLLLLDEPSEGLMPSMVDKVFATVAALKTEGIATLLVEQKVEAALEVSDRVLFLENGTMQGEATPAALAANPAALERHVGVRR